MNQNFSQTSANSNGKHGQHQGGQHGDKKQNGDGGKGPKSKSGKETGDSGGGRHGGKKQNGGGDKGTSSKGGKDGKHGGTAKIPNPGAPPSPTIPAVDQNGKPITVPNPAYTQWEVKNAQYLQQQAKNGGGMKGQQGKNGSGTKDGKSGGTAKVPNPGPPPNPTILAVDQNGKPITVPNPAYTQWEVKNAQYLQQQAKNDSGMKGQQGKNGSGGKNGTAGGGKHGGGKNGGKNDDVKAKIAKLGPMPPEKIPLTDAKGNPARDQNGNVVMIINPKYIEWSTNFNKIAADAKNQTNNQGNGTTAGGHGGFGWGGPRPFPWVNAPLGSFGSFGSYGAAPSYASSPAIQSAVQASYDAPVPATDTPAEVANTGVDLVLEDVTVFEDATLVAGPAYSVRFRNQGLAASGKFVVAAAASLDGQVRPTSPQVSLEVPPLYPGEMRELVLRLPAAAMKMGVAGTPFSNLIVKVDAADAVGELDKTNNSAVVERTALGAQ